MTELWQLASAPWWLVPAAIAVLLGVLLWKSRRREQEQRARLLESLRDRDRDRALLTIVSAARSAYFGTDNPHASFSHLLEQTLALTQSTFGFIGEVARDEENRPYLKNWAMGELAPHADLGAPQLHRLECEQILEAGHPWLREMLQQNATGDSDSPGALSPAAGWPALQSFSGLPVWFGHELVGIVGLANRPEGYSQDDSAFLAPLLGTLGQLIHALRTNNAQRDISQRLEQQRQALRSLNEIAALPTLNTVDRLQRALVLGCRYLNMDIGIISQIDDQDYRILAQYSPDNQLAEGQQFELGTTYCALTLQHEDVLAIEFMGESRFRGHPCYAAFQLESYIGVVLMINEQRYGTLNFSALAPRAKPFDETDIEFIRLMGRWIAGTVTRWLMEQERSQLLERFNKLTRHLPGVVYQYQLSGEGRSWFPYASQGMQDLYGISPEQARESDTSIMGGIHPDDRDRVTLGILESAKNQTVWREEYRFKHPVMGELWLAGNATPEALENGDMIWHGFITDITARKHLEMTIERERERLANIILGTNVGTWEWNLQTNETFINARWAEIVGYRLEELQPVRLPTWTALFHPDDLAASTRLLKRHLAGELNYYESDSRMRHKDGHWVWVRSCGRLISRDADGAPLWLSGTHTDITAQVETLQNLQESQARFQAMVSNLPGAVYRCVNDADWTMSYMSDEITRITGYPAADFVDSKVRSYASIVHPDDLHLTYKAVAQINELGVFELGYRLIHAAGHEVRVKEKGRGEFDSDGNLLWLSGFIWDATEQHRMDQLKSQFVSTVSHELRTPLTAISGAVTLLANDVLGPVPDPMRNMLQVARNNCTLLHTLIDDLLDMEKLEAGKMHFSFEHQPLGPLLRKAVEDNSGYAAQFQVDIELGQIDPVAVTVDGLRLGQILNNFLSNAVKFSHPGQSVRLEARREEHRVRISVSDQGIGIAEDFHPRLFSKFSQADATDTRQRGGTGLGLAICRELAERLDAEIGFQSAVGHGSVFWITLDMTTIEQPTEAAD